jgi:hypothetical protein
MGEYFQEPGSSEWTLKCGGKPDTTWTNIDPISKLMYRSPMCNRYTYSKDKAFKRRSGGLSAKFAKGDGVTDFCTKFGNYLQEHGMDTIAYALNPNDPTEMVFLPEKYAICNINLTKVTPSATSFYTNSFDDLDRENDAAAKDALIALDGSIGQA